MSDLIKHIDELYQKATKGPWIIGEQEFDGYAPLDANTWWGLAKVVVRLEGSSLNTSEGEANAALIVALVNAWPQIRAALGQAAPLIRKTAK